MPCLIFLELFIVVAQEFFPVIRVGSLCILLLTNIVNIHDYKPGCFLPKSYFKVAKNKQTKKRQRLWMSRIFPLVKQRDGYPICPSQEKCNWNYIERNTFSIRISVATQRLTLDSETMYLMDSKKRTFERVVRYKLPRHNVIPWELRHLRPFASRHNLPP